MTDTYTPGRTMDGLGTLARVVDTIPDQSEFAVTPRGGWPLQVEEILSLGQALTDAGYNVGQSMTRIQSINDAITDAMNANADTLLSDSSTLAPLQIAERIRLAAFQSIALQEMARIRDGYQLSLAKEGAAALRAVSDRIVVAMRKKFDPALAVIQAAADNGLTAATDPNALLESGTPAAIKAYRDLPAAVTTLDGIGRLRTDMATLANVGPNHRPIACFLGGNPTALDIAGAENAWNGVIETVQYNLPHIVGSHLAKRRAARIGGAWLALITAGYTVHLNTGAEADALLQNAR